MRFESFTLPWKVRWRCDLVARRLVRAINHGQEFLNYLVELIRIVNKNCMTDSFHRHKFRTCDFGLHIF